jgi:dTDP-4-dehydrorhamnose reductase
MTIWVTGAQGMLGRYVGRQLDARGLAWVGTDMELDIASQELVESFVEMTRPTALINCAAYTAVDAAESDEVTAQRVNAVGPEVLATACRSCQARFLHVSTDYVFDGDLPGERREDSPTGPCNVYGRTKLDGERKIVQVFEAKTPRPAAAWMIFRTSWLFGPGRSSFVDTMWQLMLERAELRVVDDQVGRPTYAGDLAALLVRAACDSPLADGVWHFANCGETTWFGFACQIRELLLDAGIEVVTTRLVPVGSSEFPRPAQRPKNSVLCTKRLETQADITPRPWQDALREYIEQRIRSEAAVGNSKAE